MSLTDNNAVTAFLTAAGIAPDKLSLLIRSVLLVLTFIWAAWCVSGEIHAFRHHGVEVDLMLQKTMRILLVVALVVVLVFIPK